MEAQLFDSKAIFASGKVFPSEWCPWGFLKGRGLKETFKPRQISKIDPMIKVMKDMLIRCICQRFSMLIMKHLIMEGS